MGVDKSWHHHRRFELSVNHIILANEPWLQTLKTTNLNHHPVSYRDGSRLREATIHRHNGLRYVHIKHGVLLLLLGLGLGLPLVQIVSCSQKMPINDRSKSSCREGLRARHRISQRAQLYRYPFFISATISPASATSSSGDRVHTFRLKSAAPASTYSSSCSAISLGVPTGVYRSKAEKGIL